MFLFLEREAAFNLLSIYNSNGNIVAKTPKKKERVKIALQVLERYNVFNSLISNIVDTGKNLLLDSRKIV